MDTDDGAFRARADELMRGSKALFDPAGLMNPGKVLPRRA